MNLIVQDRDTGASRRRARNRLTVILASALFTVLLCGASLHSPRSAEATLDDVSFLQTIYSDLLNRDIDGQGQAAWLNVITSGVGGRADAARGVLGSAEYDGQVVQALYQRLLGRSLDPGGLGYVGVLQQGVIREQVMASILGSSEYFASHGGGSNAGFLSALYMDVLHRDIDAAGQAQFGALLASGVSRGDVALMVLQSREARETLVSNLYQRLLLRTAEAAGRDAWVSLLERGGTVEDIIAGIVASDEYYNLDRSSHSIGNLLIDPFQGPVIGAGLQDNSTWTSASPLSPIISFSGPSSDPWSGAPNTPGDGAGTYGQGGDAPSLLTPETDGQGGDAPSAAVPQPEPLVLMVSAVVLLVAHRYLRQWRARRAVASRVS